MRCAFFLLTVAALHVSASGRSQTVNFTGKELTLKRMFATIKNQTGYVFFYDAKLLRESHPVTVDFKNAPLDEVLTEIFRGQPLTWLMIEKTITVRKKAVPETIRSQPVELPIPILIEVTGEVKDEEGQPLPGASLKVKGTQYGTVTGSDGRFTLKVSEPNGVLIISYVGYQTTEMPVNHSSDLKITLKKAENEVEELVVIGYGTSKRKDVTGAVSTVKPKDLDMVATPSVTQMLAGKVPGVTVMQNSAQPGGGLTLLIRGATSTGAGNEPLYVVDGFPLGGGGVEPGSGNRYEYGSRNPLNSINPYDIESIEILKDASSTAIYGARAANGVILITTKRGKEGKPVVAYSFNSSVQKISRRLDMLDATGFMKEANNYLHERWMIDNKIAPYGSKDPLAANPFTPRYSDSQIAAAGKGTDWWNELVRQGSVRQHNISVTGGTAATRYALTGNYFGQKGVVKNSDLNRYTLRSNLEQKLNSRFTTGLNMTLSQIENENIPLGSLMWENAGLLTSALMYDPTVPIRDANGNYAISPGQASTPNPVSLLEIDDQTITRRLLGNAFLEAKILEGLKARLSAGLDYQSGIRKSYLPKTTLYGAQVNGKASISESIRFDKLLNATLQYTKRLATVHNIDVLAGYEYQQFNAEGFSAGSSGFFTDAFLYNSLGVGQVSGPSNIGSYKSGDQLASYFGRLNYSFSDKYYLTLTGRVDGSTKFGANNKYAFFPSAAVSWRLIEENFIKPLEFLSDLKIRASYGSAGNQNIGQNALSFFRSDDGGYVFGGNIVNTGTYLSQIANPNLKWETTTQLNLGLDFGLFNNRVTGSFEYYQKVVSDLLGFRTLPSFSVVSRVADNIGKTQSRGIELGLHSKNTIGEFRWSTDLVLSRYKDRWKERNPNVILAPYQRNDDPIRAIYSYVSGGILKAGEEAPAYMPTLLPGQEKIQDINSIGADGKLTGKPDGKLNAADQVLIGTFDPSLVVGFGNMFHYKNFDLNIFFNGLLGRKIYDANWSTWGIGNLSRLSTGFNLMTRVNERWSHANTESDLPSGIFSAYPTSGSLYLEEGGFLRCRNITLGYTIPLGPLKKVLSTARLYVDVQNAFILTRYNGLDPETDSQAGYPNQKTYSFGVDITF